MYNELLSDSTTCFASMADALYKGGERLYANACGGSQGSQCDRALIFIHIIRHVLLHKLGRGCVKQLPVARHLHHRHQVFG